MKLKCKQCGKEFELSEGEIEFYSQKSLNLPKRCESCRNENRSAAETGGANTSEMLRKKPFWVLVLALILLAAGSFFFKDAILPAVSSNSGTSVYVYDSEPQRYTFRNESYLEQHFEKHGGEFGYADEEEYLAGANRVLNDTTTLTKTEKEDGDFVYYLPESNELVILSTDGYIRTYFRPDNGLDYFNKQ